MTITEDIEVENTINFFRREGRWWTSPGEIWRGRVYYGFTFACQIWLWWVNGYTTGAPRFKIWSNLRFLPRKATVYTYQGETWHSRIYHEYTVSRHIWLWSVKVWVQKPQGLKFGQISVISSVFATQKVNFGVCHPCHGFTVVSQIGEMGRHGYPAGFAANRRCLRFPVCQVIKWQVARKGKRPPCWPL